MTEDHYISYMQAEIRDLHQQIGHLQGRLDAAHADRDNARDEADTLTIVLTGIMTRCEALALEWETVDAASLGTFGQHAPMSVATAAELLRDALDVNK